MRKPFINLTDPRNLALTLSGTVAMVMLVVMALLWWVTGGISYVVILLSGLLVATITYFLSKRLIEKFIYDKIKIIYKTIHQLKRPKNGEKFRINITGDTLDAVNQQVLEWGQNQTREIEELKKLAAYRREYIGNVSHELKTPIFNIQGYVLTLLDGGLEDPSINREYLLRTERSINRMIAIVEDLESIAQLESGELKLNFSKFDIVGLTREVIDFLEMKVRKKECQIMLAETYEKPIYVFADKERIRQVLINLLDNAIKYGAKPNGLVKVSFFDMDEHILAEVTDNGIGISQQEIPRVFERFYRTDKGRSREQGGTGLGLAIVKHIIEAHQQTVHVRSTIGVGTTFGFTLRKSP